MKSGWDVATFIGLVVALVLAGRLWKPRGPLVAILVALIALVVCSGVGYVIAYS